MIKMQQASHFFGRRCEQLRAILLGFVVCLSIGVTDSVWADAENIVGSRNYEACIALAMQNPDSAFERALSWRDLGGGAPARHCVAVALYSLGHFGDAAMRLEDLAKGPLGENELLRIALLGQAGNAWMMTGENERAVATLTTAIEVAPDNIDLLIDRSLARAEMDDMWGAIDDLNMVLDIQPQHINALVFRAGAYRYLGSLELAADDASRALAMNPDHVAAYLERGNVRRLSGDDAGARKDWMHVLRLAPAFPAAEAARHNLDQLDVETEQNAG